VLAEVDGIARRDCLHCDLAVHATT